MTLDFLLNSALAGIIVGAVSLLGKKYPFLGALLISLPLTSILALCFLYARTADAEKVMEVSYGIVWLVIPSLILFVLLPALLRQGINFWLAMPISCAALALIYPLYRLALNRLGIEL